MKNYIHFLGPLVILLCLAEVHAHCYTSDLSGRPGALPGLVLGLVLLVMSTLSRRLVARGGNDDEES